MNDQWRKFLEQRGAHLTDDGVTDFGDQQGELATTTAGTVLCDLSHEALIHVQGEDSQEFLQGQLTNDIRAVNEYTHQLSGYCNPKGRLLALFRLFMRGESGYYLQFPRPLLNNTLQRLRMFVLRSKVMLDDVSDDLVRFALTGKDAEQMLNNELDNIPGGDDEAVTVGEVTVLRLMGPIPRFMLCGPPVPMQQLWEQFEKGGATPAGTDVWHWFDIQAAQPSVVEETVEAFVPQMLNLQLTNGVSFKKGCYTGQEVVARMQYLGKLKRRMYLAHTSAETGPKPGDELFSPDSGSGQGAGRVVMVAPSPIGGYDMLAVLEIGCIGGSGFYLDQEQTHALKVEQPPYEFEAIDQSSPEATGQH